MTTSSVDGRRDRAGTPQRPLMPRLAASATSLKPSPTARLAVIDSSHDPTTSRAPFVAPRVAGVSSRSAVARSTPPRSSVDLTSHPSPSLYKPKTATPVRLANGTIDQRESPRPGSAPNSRPRSQIQPRLPTVRSTDAVRLELARTSSPSTSTSDQPRLKSPQLIAHLPDNDQDSMFFHSNDIPTKAPTAPQPRNKSPTFVYANGDRENTAPVSGTGMNEMKRGRSAHTSIDFSSFHAGLPTSPPNSSRSVSPSKNNMHLSYRKGASQIIRPGSSSPFAPTVEGSQYPFPPHQPPRAHNRHTSIDEETEEDIRATSSQLNDGASLWQTPQGTTTSSSLQMLMNAQLSNGILEESPQHELTLSPPKMLYMDDSEPLQSPTLGAGDALSNSDAAANARRERKVLDLEISNSSLLAINRSLEKEVRKQKAELRRMRRFTRNISTGAWSASIDQVQSTGASEDVVDEDSDFDGSQDAAETSIKSDGLSDEDSSSEGRLEAESPRADARLAIADSKRLQLDLTRHKEIIMDGQRMNQCIKRCLGITDSLIGEATRALAYRVPLDEIRLGGRVLTADEMTEASVEPDDSFLLDAGDQNIALDQVDEGTIQLAFEEAQF